MKTKQSLNEEQDEFLRKKSAELPKSLRPLEAALLSVGGRFALVKADEKDADRIIKRGEVLPGKGKKVTFSPGAPNECHANAARNYMKDPAWLGIATGYALSRDGIWRQHSWNYYHKPKIIVETTERRVTYFGYVLRDEEAFGFVLSNVHDRDEVVTYFSTIIRSSDEIHSRRRSYGP